VIDDISEMAGGDTAQVVNKMITSLTTHHTSHLTTHNLLGEDGDQRFVNRDVLYAMNESQTARAADDSRGVMAWLQLIK